MKWQNMTDQEKKQIDMGLLPSPPPNKQPPPATLPPRPLGRPFGSTNQAKRIIANQNSVFCTQILYSNKFISIKQNALLDLLFGSSPLSYNRVVSFRLYNKVFSLLLYMNISFIFKYFKLAIMGDTRTASVVLFCYFVTK